MIAHKPASQRELLPLAETNLDSCRPGGTELRCQAGGKPGNEIPRPSAGHRGANRRLVVQTSDVAQADGMAGLKFKPEEILKRATQLAAPFVRRHTSQVRVVD